MKTQEKIQGIIDSLASEADADGYSKLSVCDAYYYGWDKDYWIHKQNIIDALKKRGYNVSSKTNHGVLDIIIVKQIQVS
jgi:hypothetical protein